MIKSVHFISLGCPKNFVDSQVMLGLLERDKYKITQDPAQADVIVINTCSFVQAAKEESIETILEMANYKQTGRCKALVVSGCLPQRYSKQLQSEMPEIDLLIGTGQYHRITELLNQQGTLVNRTYVNEPAFIHSEQDPRMNTGPSFLAYLKLSEGCNRRCTFCIIPDLRGSVRSRTMDSLVAEASRLALQGAIELNLVAQDLTHYGIETRYRENLAELLPRLCRVEDIKWIRLHYVYPDQLDEHVIDVMAREPKIVKYLDMPVQHTSDRILGQMGRRLTKDRLFALVERIRVKIPDIVFRTSIIVGFPGETEEEFEELVRDLKLLDFDRVGLFRYSREEGTRAAELPGQIHPSVKRRRNKMLDKILAELSLRRQKAFIGRRVPVLIEGHSDETDLLLQGRMPGQAQEIDGHVLINDLPEGLVVRPGDIVEAEITEALPHDLVGRVIGPLVRGRSNNLETI